MAWGVPAPAAFAGAIATGTVLSAAMEFLTHGPMDRRRSSFSAQFIASLGFYIVITQILSAIWGNDPRLLRATADTVHQFGGLVITESRLIQAIGCLAIIVAFFLWLRGTRVGLEFRALSDNARELAMRGYNISRLRLTAFALCGAMTASLATLSGLDSGFYSYSGLPMFMLAVVAAIIGGRFSFFGAVLGGLLLGVLRAEVEWFLSPRWVNVSTFVILVLFLLFRPFGIISKARRVEAEG